RELDLLARKAYFTSQWQIESGSLFLIILGVLFIASLRIYQVLQSKIEVPVDNEPSYKESKVLTQRWVLALGILVLILSFMVSRFSKNQYEFYANIQDDSKENKEEQIEVIAITDKVEGDATQLDSMQESNLDASEDVDTIPGSQQAEVASEDKEQPAQMVSSGDLAKVKQDILKNYNTFRGPFGLGISNRKNIPTEWDGAAGKNVKWKTAIPLAGYNSPVIWGNNIFLTGASNSTRKVFCYHKSTGKLLWQLTADNIPGSPTKAPKTTDDTGLAAPTVATDGTCVYAIFGTGDIIAADMNGKRIWAKNIGVPDNHYGHSSSLYVWNNKVFVQFDSNKGGMVMALNAKNGNEVWKTPRSSRISWASPILAEVNGKMQLVLSSNPFVAGYDTETGKELWKTDCMMGEVGPSPTYADGLIYAANEYAILVAINVKTGEIIWESDEYLPEVASPIVSKGLLFIATSYGVFACFDAKTGEMYWEHEYDEGFYSSPVIAEDKLYISDMGGVTHVFAVSKEKKVLANSPLGEKLFSTPALDDGHIYLRSNKNLYCIGK
ncbi:MAG: PQQ-binding-like beta-propeller repeat protein, partial [Bacteroidales bacterium]|nr:PQQ-binding-like beta-propeller repeat protein [Bacteroidales bacterium]